MKIVLAIDSFKGCLTSVEAENAAAEGIRQTGIDTEIVLIPVSDGGEGMLDSFLFSIDGERISVNVHDALMRPIVAEYGVINDTAVIEIAKASGLMLIEPEQRNPVMATSYGTGEIIADAIRRGYRKFIIGLGGSATSDAGIGMLMALVDILGHGTESISEILDRDFKDVSIVLASDVTNTLLGENGAAFIFAKQKGASWSDIQVLERKARTFADMSARHFGYDCRNIPGAGAAGGLGYAFMQYFKASIESGADLLLNANNFDSKIRDADLIITGEGSADAQTMMGKLPSVVLSHAMKCSVPVCLIAGKISDEAILRDAGFSNVLNINSSVLNEDPLLPENAMKNIKNTMKLIFR